MKKVISLLITLAMLIACLPVTVMAETTDSFAGGTGTQSDPYKIATAAQLKYMRDTVNSGDGKNDAGKYFVLTADIDLGAQEWTPIGFTESSNQYAFTGTFDGGGHVIKNFKITDIPEGTTVSYTNVGLFGAVQDGTIKNLGVENVSITVDNKAINRVGALVGRLTGTVTNCYAKNITCRKLNSDAGTDMSGFIGVLRGKSTITDCYVNGFDVDTKNPNRITANAFVDAAEGENNESVITNCYVVNAKKNSVTKFYAFAVDKKGGDKAPTLNNCWSTAVDGSEAKANYSRGNLGATKAGVVAAMTESAGSTYTVDKEKNAGYPCLSFEKKALVPATSFDGGDGTSSKPYKIATAEQLMYMRNLVNGENATYGNKYYELTADIDLEGSEWEPIGYDQTHVFGGKFDGKGHVVKNFKITKTYGNCLAFFGHLANKDVEISNLGIEKETINVTNSSYIAGFAARGGGKFTNCYVKNLTVSTDYGIVGAFFHSLRAGGTFENCYVYNATITVRKSADGVSGFVMYAENAANSTFTNCYTANVTNTGKFTYTLPFSFAWAKNNNGNVVHTINNCWSTLAHTKSTTDENHNINKHPDAVTCQNTAEATKDQIRAAFKDVSAYQINDAINDGFPSLKFETVEEGSDYVVAAVVPGDKVYVKLIANNDVSGAQVYVATYDSNGRLLDVDVEKVVSPYEFTTNVSTSGADTVKVFVWNGNQSPLADAYEGSL